MVNTISIICATIEERETVASFIRSIESSLIKAGNDLNCELILVDQRGDSALNNLTVNVSGLRLAHIHSKVRGLSYNRNIALNNCTGEWIMCSDADCIIDENYFSAFLRASERYPDATVFFGKILEIGTFRNIFRSWPTKIQKVSLLNRWALSTSVNAIWMTAGNARRYDNSFGLGSLYPSCEDIDFFLHNKFSQIYYLPSLVVLHPYQSPATISILKARSYSYGFGALCRKHIFRMGLFFLVASILKKFADTIVGKSPTKYFLPIVLSRVAGFMAYKRSDNC
jgi:glycosyltransferase involved in cell wall biosynthesis